MSRKHLTAKQRDFLLFLRDFIAERGVWPTYREIVEHFGYRSPNSVTQNLQALHKKGYLRRDANGFRLVEERLPQQEAHGIPIRGIISAGRLQEAVEEHLGTITLETLFPNLDRIYAIRVAGQSMQGADIHDGDYVLLIDDDIPNGGIGAVLYNGETSLKRIYYDENGLRLEPANEEYEDIYIRPDVFEEVRILGRYVGHVNRNGIFKRTTGRA
ncbi:transcriptional repressor LexA [Rhodocaloribacter litoris]|uniref:transcriptional repressor LexA n=1 Tax=Rhodocaloribacter litoris TaxID=2558931 RepID=UPI0014218802|nr:transcriptional repressor LexA [Rhodocaloribacter litoris]QXD15843.1 transcriptional repressor LexA [Rhodocaloribacter litoris]